MKNSLSHMRLSMVFAAAAAVTGCQTAHFDPHTCKKWEETNATLIPFILSVKGNTQQTFSTACDEGKAAALATLNARLPDGRIHPISAYVGKTFVEEYTKRSADSTDLEKSAYAKETLHYYNDFLKSLGQTNYSNVLAALEPQPVKKVAEPEKQCSRKNNFIMVCNKETPAAAPSSP